jgi:peptidoglycan LD-endopeptidase LytH
MVIPPNPSSCSSEFERETSTPCRSISVDSTDVTHHNGAPIWFGVAMTNHSTIRRLAKLCLTVATGLLVTQHASAAPAQTQAAVAQPLINQTVNTQIVIPAVPQTSVVITPRVEAKTVIPTPDAVTLVVEAGDLDADGSAPAVQVALGASTLEWKCPVPGAKFTNDWGQSRSGGRSHTGTDMLAPRGTPILAPFAGTALQKSSSRGGLSIYLKAPDGLQIFGAHLSSYGTAGNVKAGAIIGYVGNTGNASGAAPHLHIEIYPKKGAKTNPYLVMKKICG